MCLVESGRTACVFVRICIRVYTCEGKWMCVCVFVYTCTCIELTNCTNTIFRWTTLTRFEAPVAGQLKRPFSFDFLSLNKLINRFLGTCILCK